MHGEIEIKTSKNAAVGLLCASLLNKGKTTLRRVARIEEVNRIIEVLESIGVRCRWISEHDLEIDPPRVLQLDNMDVEAAKRTRSIIMFLGPLLHQYETFITSFHVRRPSGRKVSDARPGDFASHVPSPPGT